MIMASLSGPCTLKHFACEEQPKGKFEIVTRQCNNNEDLLAAFVAPCCRNHGLPPGSHHTCRLEQVPWRPRGISRGSALFELLLLIGKQTYFRYPNFDIHGGGMDLQFPQHESEIAQSTICNHQAPVRYWMHNNMITINGKKMGKSYNNVIKLTELFSGNHPLLSQAFHPMTVRFFILQSHYRSTLDFSNDALAASEKALKRLWEAYEILQKLEPVNINDDELDIELDEKIVKWVNEFKTFMEDDLSTPKVLANMFEMAPIINSMKDGIIKTSAIKTSTLLLMQEQFKIYLEDIMGLQAVSANNNETFNAVMQLLIEIRKEAKGKKDFVTSDKIRNQLALAGVLIKDEKGGDMSWSVE